MATVTPILACDQASALEQLMALFGRAMEGKVEITAIKASEERVSPRTNFFRLDQLDEAVAWAMEVNREHGWNVYVGAALRRESVFPGSAADDSDFLRTYAVWADADTEAQVTSAKAAFDAAGLQPAMVVITGRAPERRAQFWWTLETPISDIDVLRATVRGIADGLGTDHGVLTGKQLMRLAGSLAWPKPNKPGRVLEITELVRPAAAQREIMLERVHKAFPPVVRGSGGGPIADVEVAQGGALGLEEKIMDGREGYAFRLVRATLRQFIGENGAEPSADELYRAAAPTYLRKADQVRPGRGPEFLKAKCVEALRAYHAGQIPGMASLEEAVLDWAQRHQEGSPPFDDEGEEGSPHAEQGSDDLFEVLSIADLRALPEAEWLVKDAIPVASLGFVYGPPGSFKSFLCYDLALTVAYGRGEWIGRPVKAPGGVLYIANEGAAGAQKRITAWQKRNGVDSDAGKFHLIRKAMSFMDMKDVDRLERTVRAHVALHGPVDLIFVDTVSRVLPGADENLQKDATVFICACDRLRETFEAAVIGVHHTNKTGDMRGSTVFLGQGDFVFRVDKDEDKRGGTLACEKQKDAEDGWKMAFDMEAEEWLPSGRVESVSSLVTAWKGPAEEKTKGDRKWPHRDVLRAMQRDISAAYMKGSPLSPYPQSKSEGRHAATRLSSAYNLPFLVVKDVIETWLNNDVIEVRAIETNAKIKGLQVMKWID